MILVYQEREREREEKNEQTSRLRRVLTRNVVCSCGRLETWERFSGLNDKTIFQNYKYLLFILFYFYFSNTVIYSYSHVQHIQSILLMWVTNIQYMNCMYVYIYIQYITLYIDFKDIHLFIRFSKSLGVVDWLNPTHRTPLTCHQCLPLQHAWAWWQVCGAGVPEGVLRHPYYSAHAWCLLTTRSAIKKTLQNSFRSEHTF